MSINLRRPHPMSKDSIIKMTLNYGFLHLFPFSRKYENLKKEMKLKSGSFSEFVAYLSKEKGEKSVILANLVLLFIPLCFSLFFDIETSYVGTNLSLYLFFSFFYFFLLSFKFNIFSDFSYKSVAEIIFYILSLYLTHIFTLTFFTISAFENAVALSILEIAP